MSSKVRIALIGSGPSGLSSAAHAAELGISHVLLEAEEHTAHTIYRYQKGKPVMDEPGILPLRSPMTFVACKREAILDQWNRELNKYKVNIKYHAVVTSITGAKGNFEIRTANGDSYQAENIVLCIGLQGNIRKLGVPGEDLELVQYQLDDPDEYSGETIVVVGAGDAAIENAIALTANNRVILINRSQEFVRVKQGNIDLVNKAIDEGKIECRYSTTAIKIEAVETDGKPLCFVAQTAQGMENIACNRVIARLGAIPPRQLVESFGVEFPNANTDAVPQVSATYESNVRGLYIIGALAGYPLIKQAMNQGFEVVEYIRGNPVEPADEPLIKAKFKNYTRPRSVSEALALVQMNVPLFANMATLQLREFMLDSEVHAPENGEVIFLKDDYTNSLFSILEGEVIVEVSGADGKIKTIPLTQGQFFGEMGLLSGRRRSNTVKAGANCVLIESPRRAMLKLIASVESVRQTMDQVAIRRTVRAKIAPAISEEELDEMVLGATIKTFPAGKTLFTEGDEADGLHLIRKGSVTVSNMIAGGKEVVISYVPAGNYVGEMALLSAARRSATVRAAVNCETILLTADAFNAVIKRNPQLRSDIEAQVFQRLAENARRESAPDKGSMIQFLVSQGLGDATDVLLIDESLCVRCDNCEKACADVHDGTSLLNRQAGPTFANIHVPTSCRHCENPYCMKDCPPDAIHRNPNGEVFIDHTCIGCGNCPRNCPYGVIQMAQINPKRRPPSLLAWLLTGLTVEPGCERAFHDDELGKKAVKCDMCKDIPGGAACVRACPTGAAIRVSPEEFMNFTTS